MKQTRGPKFKQHYLFLSIWKRKYYFTNNSSLFRFYWSQYWCWQWGSGEKSRTSRCSSTHEGKIRTLIRKNIETRQSRRIYRRNFISIESWRSSVYISFYMSPTIIYWKLVLNRLVLLFHFLLQLTSPDSYIKTYVICN